MLIEQGWLTDAGIRDKDGTDGRRTPEITQMELQLPGGGDSSTQLKNFLHTLYSNQHILRRMMQSDALYIDRQMMERLDDADPADLSPAGRRSGDGLLKGCASRTAGSLLRRFRTTATRPLAGARDTPERNSGACEGCKARVSPGGCRSEDEVPVPTAFLCAWASDGPEHKPLRRVLLDHLNGYAAFRAQQACRRAPGNAQLRRKQREEAQP